jgi:hypothetical protein
LTAEEDCPEYTQAGSKIAFLLSLNKNIFTLLKARAQLAVGSQLAVEVQLALLVRSLLTLLWQLSLSMRVIKAL